MSPYQALTLVFATLERLWLKSSSVSCANRIFGPDLGGCGWKECLKWMDASPLAHHIEATRKGGGNRGEMPKRARISGCFTPATVPLPERVEGGSLTPANT